MSAMASMNLRVSPASQRGLGLIELMVALLLGLLVAGSAIAIFASNRQAYAATESLGRIQENARIAYELMARDFREAGGTSCSRSIPIANVATKGVAAGAWWSSWGGGLTGYDNGALTGSKAGTDAVVMMMGDDSPLEVVTHNPTAGTFTVNATPTAYSANDLVVVCDYRQASMLQISAAAGYVLSYTTSGLNCTKDLTFYEGTATPGVNCGSSATGIQYVNASDGNFAMLSRVRAVRWYIATNALGGTSLYQDQLNSNGVVNKQEIVEGVSGMTLRYLVSGGTDYVNAAGVGGNWSNVVAVRVSLAMQGGNGQQFVSTTNSTLTRNVDHVVALRNHEQ